MKDFLSHLFIPKESNNHRAKVLHHTNIFLTIVFLLLSTFFIQKIKATYPSVLGIQADISSDQLLSLTNTERQNAGVGNLVINDKLAQAASAKADDMFAYDYWAHNSPSGKTPWVFIKSAGYEYVYAGENLARGFTTAGDVIKAWMASPDHRANMLSSNYRDVGFSVKLGKLNGEDTVLVVEEFGNLYMPIAKNTKTQDIAAAKSENPVPQKINPVPQKKVQAVHSQPVISTSALSSNIYYVLIFVFIFALFLDMIIVEKKKVMRFVGHNIDHMLYLLLILALIGIWSKGVII
jgi:uncharacterized protein YkwD